MEELKKIIEELWDQGDINTFSQFEQEIKGKVSDKDVDGSLTLALFYYRYSLLYDEKANTAKQHWVEGPKFSENEELWDKGGKLVDKALDLIKKALELSPDSPKVLPYYSMIVFRKIRHCNMLTALPYMKGFLDTSKKTLEKGPNDPTAVLAYAIKELGRSPKMGGNPRNAISHFKKAIELDPNNAEAHFWFGRFYMSPDIKAQPKLALPWFEKAAQLNPKNWLYKVTFEEFKKAFPQ
jgi:tetratricopeptide (TPR) repeat protein